MDATPASTWAWLFGSVFVAPLAIPLGLFLWARWLARRPRAPEAAGALPMIVATAAALDLALSAYAGYGAWAAVAGAQREDASERATMLAKGISEVINTHAFGLLALLALVPVFAFLSWRWRALKGGP